MRIALTLSLCLYTFVTLAALHDERPEIGRIICEGNDNLKFSITSDDSSAANYKDLLTLNKILINEADGNLPKRLHVGNVMTLRVMRPSKESGASPIKNLLTAYMQIDEFIPSSDELMTSVVELFLISKNSQGLFDRAVRKKSDGDYSAIESIRFSGNGRGQWYRYRKDSAGDGRYYKEILRRTVECHVD